MLDRIGKDRWPRFLRGDAGIGSRSVMRESEVRELAYVFKLRVTKTVKKAIERAMHDGAWSRAGHGWEG